MKGGSQFWQGVNNVKHKFKWGATFKVNNGANVLFWEDVWVGDTPLKVQYPKLYDYSREK
jgi:hypothetical protein